MNLIVWSLAPCAHLTNPILALHSYGIIRRQSSAENASERLSYRKIKTTVIPRSEPGLRRLKHMEIHAYNSFKFFKHFLHFEVDFSSSVLIYHSGILYVCFAFHFWSTFGIMHTISQAPSVTKSHCCCSSGGHVASHRTSVECCDRSTFRNQVRAVGKEGETLVTISRPAITAIVCCLKENTRNCRCNHREAACQFEPAESGKNQSILCNFITKMHLRSRRIR